MSTTTSTLNSVLSALGGSDGIDVTSAVNTILYADRAPERAWQAQQATLATQTSAITQLESEASSLSDALGDLQSTSGALGAVEATSSNSNLVTATAVDGTPASNHVITVKNLATTGSWYSDAETSNSTQLPAGSFTITVGSTTKTISVGGTSNVNTLDDLESAINDAALGVNANIISDSSGARLALTSVVSGTAGDFSISGDTSVAFTRSGTGTDASLTIDGVPVTSASNTVTGAISGVTLNLVGASPATQDSNGNTISPATPVSISLAPDASAIGDAVTSFVSAYNTLIADVNTQIGYNTSTNTAGVLQSDSTAQGLQSALLAATNYSSGSGTFESLSSLGINTNSDGTLSLDTATLNSAISSNPTAVASFFQGSAFNGFAASLTSTLNTYTDPTQGAFTVDLQSISAENQDLTDETNQLEVYITAQQTTLTAKYNAADIAIQQLPEEIKQIQAILNPNQDSSSSN